VDFHESLRPQSHFSDNESPQYPYHPTKQLNPTPGNKPHQPTPHPITQKQQNSHTTQHESPHSPTVKDLSKSQAAAYTKSFVYTSHLQNLNATETCHFLAHH
jgi:hypothetical protein